MRRSVAILSAALFFTSALALAAAASSVLTTDDSLGLSKTSVNADSGLKTEAYKMQGNNPGENNKKIPRAYDNAPPMIPHDITAFGEITKDSNACIGCHTPEVAKAMNATPVPKTHLTNLRKGKGEDLKGELWNGRYNCTQCHASQAVLDPAVDNKFKGAFRKKTGGEYKTNLIDTIREGVVEDTRGSFDLKDIVE
jgi:nitrate reductase (cytochrome), electron transfer subunit